MESFSVGGRGPQAEDAPKDRNLKEERSENALINDYLDYLMTQKGYSRNTISSYKHDLVWLFRFYKIRNKLVDTRDYEVAGADGKSTVDYTLIDVSDVGIEEVRTIGFPDLYAFLGFSAHSLNNIESSRKRKVSSVIGFFRYLHMVRNELDNNPAERLEAPKLQKGQPHFLTLEQAQNLLDAPKEGSKHEFRDKAILTILLNTGLRVSELCALELTDIQSEMLHIKGKGNKDRIVYLNDACLQALALYLPVRQKELERRGLKENALFLSQKGGRFTNRGIEYLVERYAKKIGVNPKDCSVHTLRHTAATLMHRYGGIDIRVLQKVLGHESPATTQIYTHLDDEEIKFAIDNNPLARYKYDETIDVRSVFQISNKQLS